MTPDVARELGTGSSLTGSLTLRLKYGYAQFNFDDWLWRGTHARAGMIQTAYVDLGESVYRYRFQGPTFVDREGYLPSADVGVSFRTMFPGGYGDAVVGLYNGEGYQRVDPNDQKALQMRLTVRPIPGPGALHGLRLTTFYQAAHYVADAPRNRFVSLISYEHRYVNAGWVYLKGEDQQTTTLANAVVGRVDLGDAAAGSRLRARPAGHRGQGADDPGFDPRAIAVTPGRPWLKRRRHTAGVA